MYWRRRLLLFGGVTLLLILLVLTVKIAASNGGTTPQGSGGSSGQTTPAAPQSHRHTSAPHTPAAHTSAADTSTAQTRVNTPVSVSHTNVATSSTSSAPQPCDPTKLDVQAVAGKPTYHVGDQPLVELQVTNPGPAPCVQDLADKQIELRVYNGESRVWGSHDCQIEPGTDPRTLDVNRPVRVAVTWSGLTSQPRCAGTRQQVGAGTYTLYAVLSGHTGKATQFTIS